MGEYLGQEVFKGKRKTVKEKISKVFQLFDRPVLPRHLRTARFKHSPEQLGVLPAQPIHDLL